MHILLENEKYFLKINLLRLVHGAVSTVTLESWQNNLCTVDDVVSSNFLQLLKMHLNLNLLQACLYLCMRK